MQPTGCSYTPFHTDLLNQSVSQRFGLLGPSLCSQTDAHMSTRELSPNRLPLYIHSQLGDGLWLSQPSGQHTTTVIPALPGQGVTHAHITPVPTHMHTGMRSVTTLGSHSNRCRGPRDKTCRQWRQKRPEAPWRQGPQSFCKLPHVNHPFNQSSLGAHSTLLCSWPFQPSYQAK